MVREIYKRLLNDRFEPWLDEEDLLAGQNWEEEIRKAVRNADVVIFCLSHFVIEGGFVEKEIQLALAVAHKKAKDSLIPLKLEECRIPQELERLHCVNFYEGDGYQRLRKSLEEQEARLKKTHPKRALIAPWMLSGILLILLILTVFLRHDPGSVSSETEAKLDIEFPQEGIQMTNTNDYLIGSLKHTVVPIGSLEHKVVKDKAGR